MPGTATLLAGFDGSGGAGRTSAALLAVRQTPREVLWQLPRTPKTLGVPEFARWRAPPSSSAASGPAMTPPARFSPDATCPRLVASPTAACPDPRADSP